MKPRNITKRTLGIVLGLTVVAASSFIISNSMAQSAAGQASEQTTPAPTKKPDTEVAKPPTTLDDDPATGSPQDPATQVSPEPTPAQTNDPTQLDPTQPRRQTPKVTLELFESPREPADPKLRYGLVTLVPALIAILLAIATRQVIPALIIAIIAGAYMMVPCMPNDDPSIASGTLIGGFRLAMEKYIFGATTDSSDGYGRLKIVFFTLIIGFIVGVIGRNGGTTGLVKLVVGESKSPRRGALTAWLAGMVVFFDDYANTMIVGPTMRSVFDRLKLSRAKLAYIVDSTAAPVASIALIGTWVGSEISFIDNGLNKFTTSSAPDFLLTDTGELIDGMTAFLYSLPYRFYPLLALFLVLLVALTGRDFGPMKRAESKALSKIDRDDPVDSEPNDSKEAKPCWWLGVFPILTLVFITMGVLAVTGYGSQSTVAEIAKVDADGSSPWTAMPLWEQASTIISNADSYLAIFYGAIVAAIVSVVLTLIARACSIGKTIDAGLDGMSRIFPAVVILVLAWALSGVMTDLQLGEIVADRLKSADFSPHWLPVSVFLCAAGISFATGTSWGTMGILCPMTIDISARLMGGMVTVEALPLFYASVGSVLAGSVFGDHCSPISDTTVLSSIASGCRHEEHVWTQLPYALLAAVASIGAGDVLCSMYGQPWYYGLAAGAAFLVLFVFVIGRRAVASFDLAEA